MIRVIALDEANAAPLYRRVRMTWIFWIATLAGWWIWGGDALAIASLAVAWFALYRSGDAVGYGDAVLERVIRLEREVRRGR